MLALIVTLTLTPLLTPLLSSDDWVVRETATNTLTLLGDRAAVHRAWATATDPEAKHRLGELRTRLTIREVDAMKPQRGWPDADYHLGWPCVASDRYEWLVRLGWAHPEFYRAPQEWTKGFCYGETDDPWFYWGPAPEYRQRERTRNALIAYVSRTDDWDTVRRVLK